MTAHQYEFGPTVCQLDEQVSEIFRQLDHFERLGANETGICSRE